MPLVGSSFPLSPTIFPLRGPNFWWKPGSVRSEKGKANTVLNPPPGSVIYYFGPPLVRSLSLGSAIECSCLNLVSSAERTALGLHLLPPGSAPRMRLWRKLSILGSASNLCPLYLPSPAQAPLPVPVAIDSTFPRHRSWQGAGWKP